MTTTVPAYVRISSDRTGEALGVDRQLDEIREWAAERNMAVGVVYEDNDFSATTGKTRPDFERLLTDKPEAVIVWHQDRLLRVSKDLERVLDAGVKVHSVTAGTLDLATPTGRAVARTVAAWSTFETEQKALRQKASNKQRAAAGERHKGGQRTWGYTAKTMEVVEAEARAIRSGFEHVLAGGSVRGLATLWNAQGHTTTFGNPWTPSSVRRVLQNPIYAGDSTYDGQVLAAGTWVPLVDTSTFVTALAILSDPARRRNKGDGRRVYLLPGLATCALCGSTMGTGRTASGLRTLVCSKRHLSRSAEPVEAYVIEAVLARLEAVDIPVPARDDATVVEATKVRGRLADLATAYASDAITLEQMTLASEGLRARLAALEAQQVQAHQGDVLRALSGDVRGVWATLATDRRRAVIEAVVKDLTLTSAGRGSKTFRPETVQITFR